MTPIYALLTVVLVVLGAILAEIQSLVKEVKEARKTFGQWRDELLYEKPRLAWYSGREANIAMPDPDPNGTCTPPQEVNVYLDQLNGQYQTKAEGEPK
jgi:hypothetical protein